MKVVYVAGPYRASTEIGVVRNIRAAEELALKVWLAGAACICPHMNTAMFGGAADDSLWLKGDLEILKRCDAVMCTANWKESKGAIEEVKTAREKGIPVFEEFEMLVKWIKGG